MQLTEGEKGLSSQEKECFKFPQGTLILRRNGIGGGTVLQTSEFFYLPRVTDDSMLQATQISTRSGLSPALPLIGRPRGWRVRAEFHTGEEEVTMSTQYIEVNREEQRTVFNNVWRWWGEAVQMKSPTYGPISEGKETAFIPVLAIPRIRKGGVLVISLEKFCFDRTNESHWKKLKNFLDYN